MACDGVPKGGILPGDTSRMEGRPCSSSRVSCYVVFVFVSMDFVCGASRVVSMSRPCLFSFCFRSSRFLPGGWDGWCIRSHLLPIFFSSHPSIHPHLHTNWVSLSTRATATAPRDPPCAAPPWRIRAWVVGREKEGVVDARKTSVSTSARNVIGVPTESWRRIRPYPRDVPCPVG